MEPSSRRIRKLDVGIQLILRKTIRFVDDQTKMKITREFGLRAATSSLSIEHMTRWPESSLIRITENLVKKQRHPN